MTLLENIVANVIRTVDAFSDSAMLCSSVMTVFSLLSLLSIRGIISGLFEMHRSRSAIKKMNKLYSFGQRVRLKHVWQNCLHAKRFCRCLIVSHHCIFVVLLLELFLALLSNIWAALLPVVAWLTLGFVVGVSIPSFLLSFMLDRYPFHRWKHEYRFKKYHNTNDHDSLW